MIFAPLFNKIFHTSGLAIEAFILSLLIIGISLKLETLIYHIPFIVRGIVTFIGMILGLIFIGVEVLLFLLMRNKERFFEIVYMSIELILAVLLNSKIPYAFFVVFIIFNIGRNLIRISLVDKIYRPKEFNKYCKMPSYTCQYKTASVIFHFGFLPKYIINDS